MDILDYSTVEDGVITIGTEETYIRINTVTGDIDVKGRNLFVNGIASNGDMENINFFTTVFQCVSRPNIGNPIGGGGEP